MSELKTLKDLKFQEITSDGRSDILPFVFIQDLRAEAVKWVKELRVTIKEGLNVPSAENILTQFFNLTEDDLK